MKALAVFTIKLYKKCLSPFLPNSCRFHPSCSDYCIEAVQGFGILKGSRLFLRRIAKCHPFNPGGYDPVPTCQDSRYIK